MKKFLIALFFIFIATYAHSTTYYVDNSLGSDCAGGAGTSYSVESRDCSSSDGTKAWNTIAECTAQLTTNSDGGHICFVRSGTYTETVTPSTGIDTSHYNIYAAYAGETVNMTGYINMVGGQSYVKIIGFTFNSTASTSIRLYNTIGVQILHNTFTKTGPSVGAITSANAANSTGNRYLIIRGNEFSYLGCSWDIDHCTNDGTSGQSPGIVANLNGDYNILIEYNTAHNLSNDFVGYRYGDSIVRNNVLKDMSVLRDWPNILCTNCIHKDFFQATTTTYSSATGDRVFFESNFMKDYVSNATVAGSDTYNTCIAAGYTSAQCTGSDEHFMLYNANTDFYDNFVIRGCVVHNVASTLLSTGYMDYMRVYNNTFVDTNTKNSTAYAFATVASPGSNNAARNNLFYAVANTSLAPISPSSGFTTCSNNSCYITGTNATTACSVTTDPLFSNYASDLFYLQSGSPNKDAGTYITLTNGSGSSSTTLIVDDAGFFTSGFGIVGGVALGDIIKIGSNDTVKITDINYSTNTITIDTAQSWDDNTEIYWRNQDTTPDIGAWEYKSNYTLTGTWSLSEGTVTVTPNDATLVRFVEVLENGIPVGTDETATAGVFSVSGVGSGTVTVKMYSLYASETPIVSASQTGDVTAPTLEAITPVTTPASNTTPSYVFSSSEAGTITYGGSCGNGSLGSAISGNNTVMWTLSPGTYSNCTITVTDTASNVSTPLAVTEFVITEIPTYELTVTKSGTGYSIISTPAGVNCGSTCAYSFGEDVEVQLFVVTPDIGWITSISGDCSSSGVVAMSAARACTVTATDGMAATIGSGGSVTIGSGGTVTIGR